MTALRAARPVSLLLLAATLLMTIPSASFCQTYKRWESTQSSGLHP